MRTLGNDRSLWEVIAEKNKTATGLLLLKQPKNGSLVAARRPSAQKAMVATLKELEVVGERFFGEPNVHINGVLV